MRLIIRLLCFLISFAASVNAQDVTSSINAVGWPEANRIFHTDPQWTGSDAAYSIDLYQGRVLWLFGDAFIVSKKSFSHQKYSKVFIRNSVAIQNGYDPVVATMKYYWGYKGKKPASFFPDNDKIWYWPLDGVIIDDRLLIFLSKVGAVKTGLGFEARGHECRIVENPGDNPDKWDIRNIQLPDVPWCETFGSAVEVFEDSLYAFCCNRDHAISLARWSLESVRMGSLDNPEWWCSDSVGWVEHRSLNGKSVATLFKNGMTEFSVWRDTMAGQFLLVQTEGFGQAQLILRRASYLIGPWSAPEVIFAPPENSIPDIMIYAAKAHPYLQGNGIALTYATNGSERSFRSDSSIYYPRFIRLTLNSTAHNIPSR